MKGELLIVKGREYHYFADGNTAKGSYSLFDTNFSELDRVFILKGGPGNGKSTLIKNIAKGFNEQGYDVEYIHSTSDANSLDGIILSTAKIAIVDGTAPHILEPKVAGAVEEYVNLGIAWNQKLLVSQKDKIKHLIEQKETHYARAYDAFSEALAIHDEWESIYITNMEYEKLDSLTEELKVRFFQDIELNKATNVRHRFLGAATPNGAIDYVPNLTEGLRKRYFLKGRPGSGKSTLLKKLAATAESKGFDVEIYHCGFDPNSLDMLIFRELGIAIFDSTAPHEYFPNREGDEIIDLYHIAIFPATDEIYEEQISDIASRYREKMNEGTANLTEAKEIHGKLRRIYREATDFNIIEKIQNDIEKTILEMLEQAH